MHRSWHALAVLTLLAILFVTLICGAFSWLVWRDYAPTGRRFQGAQSPKQAVQVRNVILGFFAIVWAFNLVSLIRHPLG